MRELPAGATRMKVSEITVKNLADYLKLDYQSLSEEEILELVAFLQAAQSFISDYTGLTPTQIDIHENFVIAVYVLFKICMTIALFMLIKAT